METFDLSNNEYVFIVAALINNSLFDECAKKIERAYGVKLTKECKLFGENLSNKKVSLIMRVIDKYYDKVVNKGYLEDHVVEVKPRKFVLTLRDNGTGIFKTSIIKGKSSSDALNKVLDNTPVDSAAVIFFQELND